MKSVYFTWRAFAPSVRFRSRQTNLLLVFAIGSELSLRSEWLVGVPTVLVAVASLSWAMFALGL